MPCERGAALREALPRRAQARRHGAQRRASALQGHLAARRADPPLGRHRPIACARTSRRKLRRFLHALVGGRDGKGWEFGRPVLKPELIHLVEEVPGVEGVDHLEIRDEQRNVGDRAPPARRRRAAVPRPRSHRGEGPRRHQVMVTEALNRKRRSRPRCRRAAAREGAHRARGCGPASASSRCIARATRIATPCSSSVRRADRWSTRAPRSRFGSRAAATSSTCRRSIAAATRSAATSSATCASCSSTCSTRSSSNLDRRLAVLRSARRAARVPRLARGLDGVHARSRLARGAEARARQARRRPLSHPRHQARPDAVPEAVHRARARRSTRTRGRSRDSASRARAPRRARASRSTRWCCRRSISRTASS